MSTPGSGTPISRRRLLRWGGGAAVALGLGGMTASWRGRVLAPAVTQAAGYTTPKPTVLRHLAATDGWIHIPGSVPTYSPDPAAPAGKTTYVFGFRNMTGLADNVIATQKGKVQHSAPLLYFDQNDAIQINLTNLGLQQRPDLVDSHTIHWHGFRNALPIFDGVPEMSVATPIGQTFPYYYHPTDPGTYMYHCHFEDVEHVQMGMEGIVFVRAAQNKTGVTQGGQLVAPIARAAGGTDANAPFGYVYNDGVALGDPMSTAYDREYALFLGDMWAQAHYNDAHIQATDWSDYHADFYLMNGRSYPDTLAPNGGGTDTSTGELISPSGRPDLQHQPLSSLIQCNAGERVLVRLVNLGYTQASMRLSGIPMHIVGKDATPLRGRANGLRTGADTSYITDTVMIGAGESFDAIFTAPSTTGTYLLYNNAMGALTTPGGTGLGGQMTEVRVAAAGTYPPQTSPNDLPFIV